MKKSDRKAIIERMRAVGAVLGLFLLTILACSGDDTDKLMKSIKVADLQKHQMTLASDAYEGRESGSDGGHKAALYITEHLQKWGLEPGGKDNTWFQPLGGMTYGDLAEANSIVLYKDKTMKSSEVYKLNDALIPLRTCRPGSASGEIVFAGFGITSAEHDYDDYKGLKVKDAIVMVLDQEPQEKDTTSKWNGDKPTKYSEWDHKITNAEKNGAAALLIVDPDATGLPKYEDLEWPSEPAKSKYRIPVVYLTSSCGEELAKAASKSLKAVQSEIDVAGKPRTFTIKRPAKLSVAYKGPPGKGEKNIIGVVRGSDEKLKDEWVVVGAHYDHVGYGRFGSNGGKAGQIHNGADDNASGTCTLLEIAEAVAGLKPKRSIALMWFDAEERGLNGSKAWTGSPTFPTEKIVGMINLDMIGRNDVKMTCVGVEGGKNPKYPKLVKLMQDAEKAFQIKFDWDYIDQQQLMQRSDHWSFMQAGVPATFFTGGLHADYHTERDDPEKINYPKEELIGRIAFWLAVKMAGMEGNLK